MIICLLLSLKFMTILKNTKKEKCLKMLRSTNKLTYNYIIVSQEMTAQHFFLLGQSVLDLIHKFQGNRRVTDKIGKNY